MKVMGALDRPKRYNQSLIQTSFGFEGSLPLITLSDPDLVVISPQIYFRENFRPTELIKHVF